MSTLYLKASEDKNIKICNIFRGPWRVEMLKNLLDNPEHIAFNREFNTYTGNYKGIPITIHSGQGPPSAPIAMEE